MVACKDGEQSALTVFHVGEFQSDNNGLWSQQNNVTILFNALNMTIISQIKKNIFQYELLTWNIMGVWKPMLVHYFSNRCLNARLAPETAKADIALTGHTQWILVQTPGPELSNSDDKISLLSTSMTNKDCCILHNVEGHMTNPMFNGTIPFTKGGNLFMALEDRWFRSFKAIW